MNKRFFDITLSLLLLLIIAPLMIIISIYIYIDSPGSIFYKQVRIGKRNRPFNIFKFRTMINRKSSNWPKITSKNDPRVTSTGKILRRYKLDELPQLINVLRGDMSFVGPRPEVPKFVKYWSKEEKNLILSIRPGITDPASILFSNESEEIENSNSEEFYINNIMPKKIRIYILYIKDNSLLKDLKIIIQTILRLCIKQRKG